MYLLSYALEYLSAWENTSWVGKLKITYSSVTKPCEQKLDIESRLILYLKSRDLELCFKFSLELCFSGSLKVGPCWCQSGMGSSSVGINGTEPGIAYVLNRGSVLYSDVLFLLKCW